MGATPCGSIPPLSAQNRKINLVYYIIYKITNIINNKIYIGKHVTNNPYDNYMGSGVLIRRAIFKYGVSSFNKEILYFLKSEEEINRREKEIVTFEFCSKKDNYNIAVGGVGDFEILNKLYWTPKKRKLHCNKITPFNKYDSLLNEIKEKIKKGQILGGINTRKAGYKPINNPTMLGKKHSTLSREKMSLAHTGNKNSQYETKWITNEIINKKITKNDILPKGWRYGRINGNRKKL